jgi:transcriptional regulator with XRE-family HTH domain
MKTLGEVISDGRKEKGLNVQEASERLKISRTTLARLEADNTKLISFDNLVDIANKLEIDFFKMIQGRGKTLINVQLKSLLKIGRRICFEETFIDSSKLEELIKTNLEHLQIKS